MAQRLRDPALVVEHDLGIGLRGDLQGERLERRRLAIRDIVGNAGICELIAGEVIPESTQEVLAEQGPEDQGQGQQ